MASQFPLLYTPSMALGSMDPFLDLSREMNRLMDNFFPGASNLMGVGARALTDSLPRIDVQDDQDEICITAELPGVVASDVEVRVNGDVLSICGEKKSLTDTSLENYRVMERTYGNFRRTVPLSFTPDPQQISAEFGLGVLTIRIPRHAEMDMSQRIDVKEISEEEALAQRMASASSKGSNGGGNGKGSAKSDEGNTIENESGDNNADFGRS